MTVLDYMCKDHYSVVIQILQEDHKLRFKEEVDRDLQDLNLTLEVAVVYSVITAIEVVEEIN